MLRKAFSGTLVLFIVVGAFVIRGQQRATVIAVDVAHPGAAMSPNMFGIFFEDINFGADGGLYPERIKNRSFEFSEPLSGWHEILTVNANGIAPPRGELDIRTQHPLSQTNP